jgi:energy-converting hydrogenase A subunit R
MRLIKNFICFDLEGPLSPQDNAYELMKLFPQGDHIFRVLSRYDDLLTLAGRAGYEPGDTLALIAPFLAYHGISEEHMMALAEQASLTPGSSRLIKELLSRGWNVFCITTTYERYARYVTGRLGIAAENVASTAFPTDLTARLGRSELDCINAVEQTILGLRPGVDDDRIKIVLDRFFWRELPGTPVGKILKQVKPIGGERKVAALNRFAEKYKQPVREWAVVGDSITDFKMLRTVNQSGGLAIAFNANEYALPHATIGLASTSLYPLREALYT